MLRKKSGKRKLTYNDITSSNDGTVTQQLDSAIHRETSNEWERRMEGFADFDSNGQTENPCKRHCTDKKYIRSHYAESKTTNSKIKQVLDDVISWSSSEEDLWSSEEEYEVQNKQKLKSKRNINKTEKLTAACDDVEECDVDICESDSESVPAMRSSSISDHLLEKRQVSEVGILDYESEESRIGLSQSNSPPSSKTSTSRSSLQVNETSPEISGSKTSDTDCSQSSRSKVKASDWVKSLNLKTPTKDENIFKSANLDDSAKKKKKFKRGGFAEQMFKVQQREKSAIRIWTHQQTTPSTPTLTPSQESSKVMTVSVKRYELLYSLQLARCDVLYGPQTSELLLVLFSQELAEQYNIQQGSVVKIYPPWQQLDLQHRKQRVVLCTHFCRVMDSCKTEADKQTAITFDISDNTRTMRAKSRWNCPCVTGLVYDHRYCPAFQLPSLPGLFCQECSEDSNSDPSTCSTASDAGLQLVQATQQQPCENKIKPVIRDTLLDSIHSQGKESPGISFTGLVHRILKKDDIRGDRWILIAEDRQGTVCEINLHHSRESNADLGSCMEGKTYSFSGLAVHNRTNRLRNPAMFSMIDAVWSGTVLVIKSQDSQDKDVDIKTETAYPPGFCYVLKEEESLKLVVKETTSLMSKYKIPDICNLSSVAFKTSTQQRVTIVGRILTCTTSSFDWLDTKRLTGNVDNIVLFVTDRSLNSRDAHNHYVTVRLKHCPISKSLCDKEVHVGNVCLFRDVLSSGDELFCDGYSEILFTSDIREELLSVISDLQTVLKITSQLQPSIPCLTSETTLHSLCRVTGKVTAVDEHSAYSWEVCDGCGQDKLATKVGSENLICLACKKQVQEPATRMKMEIYVCSVPPVNTHRIKVNLLQKTIAELLPDEANEEGHDLESVLERHVGPLYCVVQNVKQTRTRNSELFLQELQLL